MVSKFQRIKLLQGKGLPVTLKIEFSESGHTVTRNNIVKTNEDSLLHIVNHLRFTIDYLSSESFFEIFHAMFLEK